MKQKGYLHLTPSLFLHSNWKKYKAKIEDPSFMARYAFYPLIHAVIKERKFKKSDPNKHGYTERGHSHKRTNDGKIDRSAKERPLHYASHFDALVYSYYAHLLSDKYELELKKNSRVDQAVIAYRKIKITEGEEQGKSTIHFAKEVFDEIKDRVSPEKEVAVLAFDITSFFSSLDHDLLKKKWTELVGEQDFETHHFSVFKACTQFNYVLLDDLKNRASKRRGFDEMKLSQIRRENGHKCFFQSNEEFRKAIKQGELSVYRNPFYKRTDQGKVSIGIPQGLALSAILANLYLLDFDKSIVDVLAEKRNGFYRRYSDDLIVICEKEEIGAVNNYVEALIQEFGLKISQNKTEKFIFSFKPFTIHGDLRLCCTKLLNDGTEKENAHLTYLGFEFRGFNTTIKSTNLSKYYRRIISVVKRRAKRAYTAQRKDPSKPLAIYLNQIKKLINKPIKVKDSERTELKQYKRGAYNLVPQPNGTHKLVRRESKGQPKYSNYYSYVQRCAEIFDDKIFLKQIRKRRRITFSAIKRQLVKQSQK